MAVAGAFARTSNGADDFAGLADGDEKQHGIQSLQKSLSAQYGISVGGSSVTTLKRREGGMQTGENAGCILRRGSSDRVLHSYRNAPLSQPLQISVHAWEIMLARRLRRQAANHP